jgi:cell division protein FtsI (penicillin-binding protein 3)
MPDVRGMGARDAVYIIENRGAKVIIEGTGKVRRQSKPAGSVIKSGEIITLYLT